MNPQRSIPSAVRRNPPGFTLAELLGVLAIVALLGAIGVASALKQLKQGQGDSERASLDALVDAFTNSVKATYTVPDPANWVPLLAAQLGEAPGRVGTNLAGNARRVWMDPTMLLGATTNAPNFPFVQGLDGSTVPPGSVRVLILSSLADPVPPLGGLAFSNVWDAPVNALPTGWPANWTGEAADLHLRRIALDGLFYRLVLNNLDATNAATWTLNSSGTGTALAAGGRREQWVLDGTTVSLTDGSGTLSICEPLHADASYVYEGGRWLRHLTQGVGAGGDSGPLGALIDDFIALPAKPGSAGCRDCWVESVFGYLRAFGFWGRDGAFSRSGAWTAPHQRLSAYGSEIQNLANSLQ